MIKKIKLHNFKRFKDFSVDLNEKLNLLIGDNESGKSTLLSAIDIVISGSRTKIDSLGLESLFNRDVIQNFLNSDRRVENLPEMYVELYLSEQNNLDLNGKENSDGVLCDGLRLTCKPNDELSKQINEILQDEHPSFPYEYYSINFYTFSGEGYIGLRKYLRHVLLDNTQISNEYATRDYIKTIYDSYVQNAEKNKHQFEYRKYKDQFKQEVLSDLNNRLSEFKFTLKTGAKENLETDLTISENDINIENKGKGRQCFIKTEFALKKKIKDKDLDVILIEEPENHLSHTNMKKLITKIANTNASQLFIATHNDLISTRLDLTKAILLNSNSQSHALLKDLPYDTARFFMKSSDNNVLEFILSKKVILVEGTAEYILMDQFFQNISHRKSEDADVHIISVGGTSFKRYLDLSVLLNIKTAVIRDNDKNYQENCVHNYSNYQNENIRVFSDTDNNRYTFEVALYTDNKAICDQLFVGERRSLSVQDYMLSNKADAAYILLVNNALDVNPPTYISEAVKWINE